MPRRSDRSGAPERAATSRARFRSCPESRVGAVPDAAAGNGHGASSDEGSGVPAGVTIERDRSLRNLHTFGFELTAERYAEATDEAALGALFALADRHDWPVLLLGGGSNVVPTDDVPGLVVRFVGDGVDVHPRGNGVVHVRAEAGKGWHELVTETLEAGLPGLENLALIPGSVGAAPVQNIGAYGVELSERLVSVRALHRPSGLWHELDVAACGFGYRDSRFKREAGDWAITAVTFELGEHLPRVAGYASLAALLAERGIEEPSALDIRDAVVAVRRSRLPDPAVLGNAGSFFQNPLVSRERAEALLARFPDLVHYAQPDGQVKLAAGWLIDQLGFRGHSEGGIGVHETQALVLVHEGGGSAETLLGLVERILVAVEERFGVRLQIEPTLI